MLSAATHRFSRASPLPSSSSSSSSPPLTKQERRLSRISPSEFDSILESGNTVKLASTQPAPPSPDPDLDLDLDLESPPASPPASPHPSPPSTRAGLALPPGLSPDSRDRKRPVRRARSALGTVAEAPPPPRALESWDASATSSTSTSRPRGASLEARVVDSPSSRGTAPASSPSSSRPTSSGRDADARLPTFPSSIVIPSRTPRAARPTAPTTAPADPDADARPLSSSTLSTGSFVHVPFPPGAPVEHRAQGGGGSSGGGAKGVSAAALAAGGFEFGAVRRRTQSGEGGAAAGEGKMSLAGTMRKTSRFFRKLGGGASSSPSKSTSTAPSTPFADTFRAPLAPPPPSLSASRPPTTTTSTPPASLTSPSSTSLSLRSSTARSSSSPAPRSPRVNRRALPRLPPPADMPSPDPGLEPAFGLDLDLERARERSAPLARDASHDLALSSRSGRSAATARASRRRSASLGSLVRQGAPVAQGEGESDGHDERARTRTEEDDRLRSELRRWRLGGDGVLGTAAGAGAGAAGGEGGTLTPSSSLGAVSASGASRSSPQLVRDADTDGLGPPAVALEVRRASVPARGGAAGGSAASGRASLPAIPSLSPLPAFAPSSASSPPDEAPPSPSPLPTTSSASSPLPSHANSPAPSTPEIRLTPSSRNGSVSSAVTIGPSPSPSTARGSVSSASTADGGALGLALGLGTIVEAAAAPGVALAVVSTSPVVPDDGGAKPLPPSPRTKSPPPPPATALEPVDSTAPAPVVGLPPLGAPAPPAAPLPSSATSSSFASLVAARAAAAAAAAASTPSRPAPAPGGRARPPPPPRGGQGGGAGGGGARRGAGAGGGRARGLAELAWDEDKGFVERRKIAEWLGSANRVNAATLRLYVDKFDFAGLSLDAAFRRLCGKLYLKGETQQVDRILEQFSRRYFDDNPKTVYGSSDVVHAVSYSLLLLNTDLHVVDSTTRMTRQQFIRNTLDAIRAQTGDDADGTERLADDHLDPTDSSSSVFRLGSTEASSSHKSLDRARQSASVVGLAGAAADGASASPAPSASNSPVITRTGPDGGFDSPARSSRAASTPVHKLDEVNLQAALKDMYNAIKSQPVYQISSDSGSSSALHLPHDPSPSSAAHRSSFSLSPGGGSSPYATWGGGGISRAASRRSATSVASGTTPPTSVSSGSGAYKRASIRGMGAFLGASSSLDLVRSTSPTPSTATSLSDERWNTAYGPASQHHHVPTIGFANSLSHTIIREQHEGGAGGIGDETRSEASEVDVSDEELALLGAPWAKEGILSRKHYWESSGRRAKDKGWVEAFVVVSQGELKMFRFGGGGGGGSGGSGSSRGAGGVGGGDWTANASAVGSVSLIHALCSAMPPPGYSRERPHCFVLTLPGGGSYFFQAGTPDLVAEWVSTCNYWAARLSKEPLSGGVSNMEYGWNRVADSSSVGADDDLEDIASIRSGRSRRSYASSAFHSSALGAGADRTHVNEWKPPQVPLAPSHLGEEAQLEALRRHSVIVQRELAQHGALRGPMTRLYPSRSAAGSKALANWERKSQHLAAEGVKYRTYVDALASAIHLRALRRGKKQVERMLELADRDADEATEERAVGLSPLDDGR
ncbi:hypothetical protein JCM9279_001632 [Rhodotorula babjevae]